MTSAYATVLLLDCHFLGGALYSLNDALDSLGAAQFGAEQCSDDDGGDDDDDDDDDDDEL